MVIVNSGRLLVASAEPQVKDGRLRALAILSKRRSRGLPDALTMAEAGYPEVEGDGWGRSAGAARIPKEIIAAFHREIARIIAPPDTTERTRLLPARELAGLACRE